MRVKRRQQAEIVPQRSSSEMIIQRMGVTVDDRLEQARRLYERAVFGGDASGLAGAERYLSAVEADLALARGRILHARLLAATSRRLEAGADVAGELVLFERAVKLYRNVGDVRGEAEAQFWVGACHQVVRNDDASAVPALERARALATQADDPLSLSYALRHLGIAEHRAGHLDKARSYLEESTRLRRQIGFGPGVTANLVGLAYIAASDGRAEQVPAMLGEADSIARGAPPAGITRQIDEARQHLTR
jgi:tetratricopeptide (TPR) repeat protein